MQFLREHVLTIVTSLLVLALLGIGYLFVTLDALRTAATSKEADLAINLSTLNETVATRDARIS